MQKPFVVSLFHGKDVENVARVQAEKRVTFAELPDLICKQTYSLIQFKDLYRKQSNFKSSQVVALDIDGGLTLYDAIERLKKLEVRAIVGLTRSHGKQKNGKAPCDRFRILIELSRLVTDLGEYRATIEGMRELFPESDPAPKDGARYFFPCTEIAFTQWTGHTVSPEKSKKQVNRPLTKEPVKLLPDEIDQEAVWKRAVLFLGKHPPAIQHEGGDQHTFLTAAHLFDLGIPTPEACMEVLEDSGWNDTCEPPWTSEELLIKCQNAYSYRENPIGVASPEVVFNDEVVIEPPTLTPEEAVLQSEEVLLDWRFSLNRTGKKGDGPPKDTIENVVLILKNAVSPIIFKRDVFAYRDFYGCNTPWGGKTGELVSDNDVSMIIYWLGTTYRFEPKAGTIHHAIAVLATANGFHPVREMLERLPEWDGVGRLDNWLKNHFEAEGDPAYLAQVFRKWMVAAITRIFRPGAKFDWMIIFEGTQGVGKSSFGRLLVGDAWFTDWLPELSNKDAALALQGMWGVEMAELSTLKKNAVEMVKGFVTRTVDKVRPPYGRRVIETPRQCVFYGTTNQDKYLVDETGNRRFKPVKVGQLDFKKLAEDKDQLWAEALFIFNEKLEPHLNLDEDAKAFESLVHQEKLVRTDADVMAEQIQDFFIDQETGRLDDQNLGQKIDQNQFQLKELFGAEGVEGPLSNWRYDNRNEQFASRALKMLNAKNFRAGRKWHWKLEKCRG